MARRERWKWQCAWSARGSEWGLRTGTERRRSRAGRSHHAQHGRRAPRNPGRNLVAQWPARAAPMVGRPRGRALRVLRPVLIMGRLECCHSAQPRGGMFVGHSTCSPDAAGQARGDTWCQGSTRGPHRLDAALLVWFQPPSPARIHQPSTRAGSDVPANPDPIAARTKAA
jgi:hypothetical protein